MTVETPPVAEIDPFLDVFTAEEERMATMIRGQGEKAITLKQVGLAIGAAFLLYRFWMWRRLKEETLKAKLNPTPESLYALNSKIFADGWSRIAWTMVPALVSGYSVGLRDVAQQNYSRAWMTRVAEDYAISLVESLHDTSAEALMEGYQAQLNRNLANRKAVDNVIDAFGVTPRTMRTLVNLWAAPTEEVLTAQVKPKRAKQRADRLIAQAIAARAEAIGATESYAAKNNAKSIVWLYLKQEGQLPADATKMWVTADDEKTCPVCAPLHHTQVPLDEKFTTAQGDVWAPALHPNCRCDIVLRGVVQIYDSGEYLEEMAPRELEVAKSAWGVVSKAKGGDPIDRDKKGRFAATESRGGRVQVRRTGVVRGQLDQDRAAQIAASNRKAQEEARQNAKLLTDEERAAIAAHYQKVEEKLAGTQKISAAQKITAPQAKVSAPQEQTQKVTAPQKITASETQKVTATQNQKVSATAQQKIKGIQTKITVPEQLLAKVKAPPVMEPTSDKWEVNPGNDVLYALFTDVGHEVHFGGDDDNSVILADQNTMFYTSQKHLENALNLYWNEVLWDDLVDRFQNEPSYVEEEEPGYEYDDDGEVVFNEEEAYDKNIYAPGYITTFVQHEGQKRRVKIDFDTYRQLYAASLPDNHVGYNRWTPVELAEGSRATEPFINVDTHELMNRLGTTTYIEEKMPLIGVTAWINVKKYQEQGHIGARTNEGKWQLKSHYGGGGKLGYDMVHIDPDDLFDDQPETEEIIDLPWEHVRSPYDD